MTGMQMVQRRWDGRDGLLLRLSCIDVPPAELTQRMIAAVYKARPLYPAEVALGAIHDLLIEWVPRSALVTNPRTGKLVQVVDERPISAEISSASAESAPAS
jgi:phenylacetate-CoA ligase